MLGQVTTWATYSILIIIHAVYIPFPYLEVYVSLALFAQ
jgi:hypothetical protein